MKRTLLAFLGIIAFGITIYYKVQNDKQKNIRPYRYENTVEELLRRYKS